MYSHKVIDEKGRRSATSVEHYWGKHTVNSRPFKTAEESLWYLSWRNEQYPFFKELMFPKFRELSNKVILDYGCGPGNDLVTFFAYTQAKKIIGVDVSKKALSLSRKRLFLHRAKTFRLFLYYLATLCGYRENRLALHKVSDSNLALPVADESVDYVHCSGVLMNLSNPQNVLKEFRRVLKPDGIIRVMVYNSNSIWRHLYVGYQKMVLGQPLSEITASDHYYGGSFYQNMSLDEVFKRSTDGEDCPVSFSFTQESFTELAAKAGLSTTFIGSYFSTLELEIFETFSGQLDHLPHFSKLNKESQAFLKELEIGPDGYPKYRGANAGIGAIYELKKLA